jgi:hypothetical protein
MTKKTVTLTKELLIGTRHYPAGTRLTVPEKKAVELFRSGVAIIENCIPDHSLVEPPPAKRAMLPTSETTSTTPPPRRAARHSGSGQ